MLKRVVVDIMQNIAPAFVVVCVLLCLSFSYTLPLHRPHSNELTEQSNRSQKCGTATVNRAKKMTPTDKQDYGLDDFSEAARQYAETAKRKLTGDDLRQYEQLVIMKKYPYLDLKEFELKYGPSVKNVKYVRDAEIAGGGDGECKLTDDGPHVEIFNRGISGFAIPKSPTNVLKSEQVPRSENKPDDARLGDRDHPRGWDTFKDLAGNDLY